MDALSNVASLSIPELTNQIYINLLRVPSNDQEDAVFVDSTTVTWMTSTVLKNNILPNDNMKARKD